MEANMDDFSTVARDADVVEDTPARDDTPNRCRSVETVVGQLKCKWAPSASQARLSAEWCVSKLTRQRITSI
jgi:hypothetical protein